MTEFPKEEILGETTWYDEENRTVWVPIWVPWLTCYVTLIKHLTSLCFSLLLCKMEVMKQPTLCGVVVKINLLYVILIYNIIINNKRVIYRVPKIVSTTG